jgi:hypothetical protein
MSYYALLSMVFMMSFVVVFDGFHRRNTYTRVLTNLLSRDEVDRLVTIWSACQEG